MDTEYFLSRVVPSSGNYLTIQFKGKSWVTRSWPLAEGVADAADRLQWAGRQGMDAYHAIAAFTTASVTTSKDGKQNVVARREQANVHLIKALVIDADVAREGDGKDRAKVFADREAAATWLVEFLVATNMPPPNLAMNSGYGFHWYWLLETPLTLADWQPLANALRTAMVEHNWIGDTSPTIDGARLLRPPGTVNMKSGTPVPVSAIDRMTGSDYPNAEINQALTPWVHAVSSKATGTHGGATLHSLGHSLGPRPSHIPPGPGPNIGAHAQQGMQLREHLFRVIATKCAQAQLSLSTHGANIAYPKWYLADLSLLEFCADGSSYTHDVSKGHAKYTHADTEAAVARIHKEATDKGLGAPHCRKFDEHHGGICPKCPFWTKILSPISLGVDDGDLPVGYRRAGVGILSRIERASNEDGKQKWSPLIGGDFHSPRLDRLTNGGHQITMLYELAGDRFPIAIKGAEAGNPLSLMAVVERQGLSPDRHNIGYLGDFAVAWINKLRELRAAHKDNTRPFGWNFAGSGERLGLAIAGTLYKADGTEEWISGGDPNVVSMYTPAGTMEDWRRVAALFQGPSRRADLQALIAVAFATPLVGLCSDVRGMSWNFWSTESGVGKTSALRLAQSVWGEFKGAQSMDDTPYSVMKTMSELRVLPKLWDELRVQKTWREAFMRLIYTIPQGKDRTRLMSDTTLRDTGEWETHLLFTSNRSMADYLTADNTGTDSGLARILEIQLRKTQTNYDPAGAQVLKLLETNYGHAGRVYAKWLAMHVDEVKEQLRDVLATLTRDLDAQQEERFYTTAIACNIVGAVIATKLGLFDFNVRGIHQTLVDAFNTARTGRVEQTVVSATGAGYNLEQIFADFMYEQVDYRLRTKEFAYPGRTRIDIIHEPRSSTNKAKFQIAEDNKIVRVVCNEWNKWLHAQNLPANTITEQMDRQWNVRRKRQVVGGGTKYRTGQTWTLDVPLTGALASFLSDEEKEKEDKPLPDAAE